MKVDFGVKLKGYPVVDKGKYQVLVSFNTKDDVQKLIRHLHEWADYRNDHEHDDMECHYAAEFSNTGKQKSGKQAAQRASQLAARGDLRVHRHRAKRDKSRYTTPVSVVFSDSILEEVPDEVKRTYLEEG